MLGGGNVKNIEKLPPETRLGDNRNAFVGGFRLWKGGPRLCLPSAAVRRFGPPPGKELPHDRLPSDALVLFGVTGDLAYKMIFPGTLCDDETRYPQGPGNWRRAPGVESGASAQTRNGQHKAIGRHR